MEKVIKISPIYTATLFYLSKFRIVANQGGTRSGKTFNTMMLLNDIAKTAGKGVPVNGVLFNLIGKPSIKIDVVSQTLPHLRGGAMADFKRIKKDIICDWDDASWHGTNKTYTYKNGSTINFFSLDKEGKARGLGRDILFVNEINRGIKESIWNQLLLRTTGKIIIDWNPSEANHWIYSKVISRTDCKLIISTYLDNYDFLPKAQILEIERLKEADPVLWKVFGEGLRGNNGEGNVFTGWKQIDYKKFPKSKKVFGLDFGYRNDPTVLVEISKQNGDLFIKECLYVNPKDPKNRFKTGLNTRQLIEQFNILKIKGVLNSQSVIYADSSEPRAIADLVEAGFNVMPAKKGAGSIKNGIDYINCFLNVFVERTSYGILLEYEFYKMKPDPKALETGVYLSVPIEAYNHAMDAIRYACEEWRGLHNGLKTTF